MIRPGVSDDPPPTERTASSSGGSSHEVALNMVGRLEWQGSKLIRIPFRISKLSFLKKALVTRRYTMTKPALISVKASLTKMTLLLATSCGASAVTPCLLKQCAIRQWERSVRSSVLRVQLAGDSAVLTHQN